MGSRIESFIVPAAVVSGALLVATLCTILSMAWAVEGPVETGTPDTAPTPPADAALAALMEEIKVVRTNEAPITWYSPRFQPYSMYDFRVYPIIGLSDDGRRKIGLQIALKDPPKGQPTSVRARLDGEPWNVPVTSSDDFKAYDSGCRTTNTLLLQSQETLIRAVAAASQVEFALEGYRGAVRYKLSEEDLENFKRILTLWEMKTLPAIKEDPPPGPAPPTDARQAGEARITNPEIIPRSKIPPRFPRFARGKNVLGRVILTAIIRKDGTVGDIQVVRGAGGDCGFEAAAIEAVSKWRYKPATKDGEPVDVYFTITIDFTYDHYKIAPG